MKKSRHLRTTVVTIAVLFSLLCWHNANSNYSMVYGQHLEPVQSKEVIGGAGWYKTKWGMTPEEINAALGNKIVPVPQQDRGKYDTEYQYTIPEFKIGKFSFSVYLAFKSGKGLTDVMVTKKGQSDHFACFLELEDALKKKYGSPSSVEDDVNMKKSSQFRSREWLTQSSVIKLNNITLWIDSKPHFTTNVLYSARSSGGDRL